MQYKDLLEALHSLSSNHDEFIDSKIIHQTIADHTLEDIHSTAVDLHNQGIIKVKFINDQEFQVALTENGMGYLRLLERF
jgi:citrate lyase alpha subunit